VFRAATTGPCSEPHSPVHIIFIQGCWEVLSRTRKETSYSDRRFWCSYILFFIIIGGILVLFIGMKRLALKEIFSPSNKIHWVVGRAKDLSAPRYYCLFASRSTKASLEIVFFFNDKLLRATQIVRYSTVVVLCHEAVLWRTLEIRVSNIVVLQIWQSCQFSRNCG
jgi:hypothetical protein